MDFKDKLIFLMNITQTSNKELAKGISVDPSLISLLRSGKRKQPQNVLHIKNMALFLPRDATQGFSAMRYLRCLDKFHFVLTCLQSFWQTA